MAKTLNSISLDAPSSPVSAAVSDTFSFQGTPGFTGTGGVNRYDWKWEVDSGGGYVTIASSGTGLTTSDTNPLVNSNSQTANSITVTCTDAGSYTIRMAGAPATGGSYTVFSSTQSVTVTAVDALLADDVQSTSQVSSPAIGQIHVLDAGDVQSTSQVGAPALGQVHALLADDVESTSELTAPVLADFAPGRIIGTVTRLGLSGIPRELYGSFAGKASGTVDNLLANDVESASEVTAPAVGQIHVLDATDVESASELTVPAVGQVHALLANDVESASELTTPAVGQIHALTATSIESASELTTPAVGQEHALTANDVESASEVSAPTLLEGTHVLFAEDVESASELTIPAIGQVHVLLADDIESNSELTAPTLAEISGETEYFIHPFIATTGQLMSRIPR